MPVIEIIYFVCFLVGLGFAVISGLFSGFGGDVDAGGGDLDIGDAAGVSPLSPVVLATFIATFGGTGIILLKFKIPIYLQIPIAAGAALVLSAGGFYVFWKVVSSTTSQSQPTMDDVIGIEAEVTTPIPSNGLGSISYTAKEQRYQAPARSLDNSEIPARAIVRIVKVVSNTFYVERTG